VEIRPLHLTLPPDLRLLKSARSLRCDARKGVFPRPEVHGAGLPLRRENGSTSSTEREKSKRPGIIDLRLLSKRSFSDEGWVACAVVKGSVKPTVSVVKRVTFRK